jgi:RNA polymerase sigma factor (TIGR02999 family)
MSSPPLSLPALVQACDGGAPEARAALFAALYAELHRIARRESARYGALAGIGATTLLHEAFLHLQGGAQAGFKDQAHFLAYAARAMRGLAIDQVRAAQADKRGGGLDITHLNTDLLDQVAGPQALVSLGDALDELARHEPALAHLVDLKFFCGISLIEIAALTGVSERTAQRQWDKAKLLLRLALQ